MCPTLTVVAPVSQGSPTLSCSVNQTSATQSYAGQSESFSFTVSGIAGSYSWSMPGSASSNGSTAIYTAPGIYGVSVKTPSGISVNCGTVTVNGTGGGEQVVGACGSAVYGIFSSAPQANLCSMGTPSTPSGSGPWAWTCSGSGGGANTVCITSRGSSTAAPSVPTLTGIQGYDPSSGLYTAEVVKAGTYLILYGKNFSGATNGNSVAVTPVVSSDPSPSLGAISFQSSGQINIPLESSASGIYVVSVTTSAGQSNAMDFEIVNSSRSGGGERSGTVLIGGGGPSGTPGVPTRAGSPGTLGGTLGDLPILSGTGTGGSSGTSVTGSTGATGGVTGSGTTGGTIGTAGGITGSGTTVIGTGTTGGVTGSGTTVTGTGTTGGTTGTTIGSGSTGAPAGTITSCTEDQTVAADCSGTTPICAVDANGNPRCVSVATAENSVNLDVYLQGDVPAGAGYTVAATPDNFAAAGSYSAIKSFKIAIGSSFTVTPKVVSGYSIETTGDCADTAKPSSGFGCTITYAAATAENSVNLQVYVEGNNLPAGVGYLVAATPDTFHAAGSSAGNASFKIAVGSSFTVTPAIVQGYNITTNGDCADMANPSAGGGGFGCTITYTAGTAENSTGLTVEIAGDPTAPPGASYEVTDDQDTFNAGGDYNANGSFRVVLGSTYSVTDLGVPGYSSVLTGKCENITVEPGASYGCVITYSAATVDDSADFDVSIAGDPVPQGAGYEVTISPDTFNEGGLYDANATLKVASDSTYLVVPNDIDGYSTDLSPGCGGGKKLPIASAHSTDLCTITYTAAVTEGYGCRENDGCVEIASNDPNYSGVFYKTYDDCTADCIAPGGSCTNPGSSVSCSSPANSCGMKNSGTMVCLSNNTYGTCSAFTPADDNCGCTNSQVNTCKVNGSSCSLNDTRDPVCECDDGYHDDGSGQCVTNSTAGYDCENDGSCTLVSEGGVYDSQSDCEKECTPQNVVASPCAEDMYSEECLDYCADYPEDAYCQTIMSDCPEAANGECSFYKLPPL